MCSSQKICCFVFLSKMFRLTKQNFLLFSREPVKMSKLAQHLSGGIEEMRFRRTLFRFEPLLGLMQKSLKYCCCTITAVASICAVQSDHLRCFPLFFASYFVVLAGILAMRLAVAFIRKLAFYKKKISKRGVNEYIFCIRRSS